MPFTQRPQQPQSSMQAGLGLGARCKVAASCDRPAAYLVRRATGDVDTAPRVGEGGSGQVVVLRVRRQPTIQECFKSRNSRAELIGCRGARPS